MALYQLQEFKDCEKPLNKRHSKSHENVMHYFILNGKELPINYSTTADVLRDVFVMFIFKILRFRRDHVVIETPIKYVLVFLYLGVFPPSLVILLSSLLPAS